MKKVYKVFIVPQEILACGENEEEAIEEALKYLKEYKDRLFVAKEVEEENGED